MTVYWGSHPTPQDPIVVITVGVFRGRRGVERKIPEVVQDVTRVGLRFVKGRERERETDSKVEERFSVNETIVSRRPSLHREVISVKTRRPEGEWIYFPSQSVFGLTFLRRPSREKTKV